MVLPVIVGAITPAVLIVALAVIGLIMFLQMTTKLEGVALLIFPIIAIYLLVK